MSPFVILAGGVGRNPVQGLSGEVAAVWSFRSAGLFPDFIHHHRQSRQSRQSRQGRHDDGGNEQLREGAEFGPVEADPIYGQTWLSFL